MKQSLLESKIESLDSNLNYIIQLTIGCSLSLPSLSYPIPLLCMVFGIHNTYYNQVTYVSKIYSSIVENTASSSYDTI